MRVLFTIFPVAAHLYPVVPLATALQSAGHEVRVAAHAGIVEPDIVGSITAAGLIAVPLGGKEDIAPVLAARTNGGTSPHRTDVLAFEAGEPGAWEAVRPYLLGLLSLYYPPAPRDGDRLPMVDDLVAFARDWRPDLVVWDPLCPPGAVAARVCGAAHARLLWGRDHVAWIRARTLEQLARPVPEPAEDPFRAWMAPMLARYGLDFTEETLHGQWSLDLAPAGTRLPLDLRYVPLRRVPYTGAAAVPGWLHGRPERPRVCLTLGSSTRKGAEKDSGLPIAGLLEALADLDAEVVATLNRDQLASVPALPANVRAVDYVPLTLLLPTCSAIVHHGGGGTFAAAVAHRVPQVVIPVPKWDEAATGRYVQGRGAGLTLPREGLHPVEVRKALVRVLEEPSFRHGAEALHADWLAAPGPLETVPVLERLTELHRGRGEALTCA
jgi:glycosyltransferase (activator-dependent family)